MTGVQTCALPIFQVLHHDELTFEFDGTVKFKGLEVAEELLVQPEDLRRGYLQALERFNQELDEIAQRNRCELVRIDTRRDLSESLIDYLNQRNRVRSRH